MKSRRRQRSSPSPSTATHASSSEQSLIRSCEKVKFASPLSRPVSQNQVAHSKGQSDKGAKVYRKAQRRNWMTIRSLRKRKSQRSNWLMLYGRTRSWLNERYSILYLKKRNEQLQ